MGDTLDIQNILQTGYFTTSRARGSASSSQRPASTPPADHDVIESAVPRVYEEPRTYSASPKSSQFRPPRPIVEDEAESLAKEHGSSAQASAATEEPQNRGQYQQEFLLEEVHEHNPERRFVHVPKSDSDGDEQRAKQDRKRDGRRRPDNLADRSDERRDKPQKSDPIACQAAVSDDRRKKDRSDARDQGRERMNGADRRPERQHEPVFDERAAVDPRNLEPPPRKANERRRSRHDLPRIDTRLTPDDPKPRPRTKSAVGGSRPDFFGGSHPSRSRDDRHDSMLSPDVIKHGSSRRGDRAYHGYGYSAGSGGRPSYGRSLSNSAEDRDRRAERDEGTRDYYSKGRSSPSSSRRSSAYHKASADDRDRKGPGERSSDGRRREDPPSSTRSHRREGSKSSRQDDESRRAPSTGRSRESRPAKEESRSSDESSRGPKTSNRRRRESVIVQDERRSAPNVSSTGAASQMSKDSGKSLPTPRNSLPSDLASSRNQRPDLAASGTALAAGAGAATAAAASRTSRGGQSSLPYPEEDSMTPQSPQGRASDGWYQTSPSDTDPVQERDGGVRLGPGINSAGTKPSSTVGAPSSSTRQTPVQTAWGPGSFAPERDALPVDKPIGSFRRYSENRDASGPPQLPQCRFTTPVTGNSAWLTLPRSEFNICTECYTAVFADTSYRTQFHPMLYSAEKPIACDFGSSPWYRIAWLLTLRSEIPDLRLFYSISQIATMCQAQPCPGDRKTLRTWLTILDPQYRMPIPNFAVCLQCAKTVEALLPNMSGAFVPWDPRSEPTRAVCSLHYKPQRKEFVLFFDILETASDEAHAVKQPPDMDRLSMELEKLSVTPETCPRDNPVVDGYWHTMQYIQGFTVCGRCFDEVVQPKVDERSLVARNFFQRPQLYKEATCQLYSDRMREAFRKACRKEDFDYLQSRVKERVRKEAEIHRELERLDRSGHDSSRVADRVKLLLDEWKQWE